MSDPLKGMGRGKTLRCKCPGCRWPRRRTDDFCEDCTDEACPKRSTDHEKVSPR